MTRRKSTWVRGVGTKKGRHLVVTFKDGFFSPTGSADFDYELVELSMKPVRIGRYLPGPKDLLLGARVFADFFDELEKLEYDGEPPKVPDRPNDAELWPMDEEYWT